MSEVFKQGKVYRSPVSSLTIFIVADMPYTRSAPFESDRRLCYMVVLDSRGRYVEPFFNNWYFSAAREVGKWKEVDM